MRLNGEFGTDAITDNTYNVVTFALGAGEDATLDGVTVHAGYDERLAGDAGGIIIEGGTPTIHDVGVANNHGRFGGGLHVKGGAPIIDRVRLVNNGEFSAGTEYEGGLAATGGTVVFSNSFFTAAPLPDGTLASFAGANALIDNVQFGGGTIGLRLGSGRHLVKRATFIYNDVGLVASGGDADILRASFFGNKSAFTMSGGQLDIQDTTFTENTNGFAANAAMTVRNSTFVKDGQGVSTVAPAIVNSIIQLEDYAEGANIGAGKPPTSPARIRSSVIDFGCSGGVECTDTIQADALLRPAVITDGSVTPHFPLFPGSPAIDIGDPAACTTTDQRLVLRPLDGNLDGSAICDAGSFEFDPLRIAFEESTSAVGEDSGTTVLTVTAKGDLFDATSFAYAVSGGSATSGSDFSFAPGTFTFDPNLCPGVTPGRSGAAPGSAVCVKRGNIDVQVELPLVVRQDFLVEAPETIELRLSDPPFTGVVAESQHTLTIRDDEPRLRCDGVPATMVGSQGKDLLVGTGGRDVIVARGGNDRVLAGGGRDLVCAGPGDDTVRGGPGTAACSGTAAPTACSAASEATGCLAAARATACEAARETIGWKATGVPTTCMGRRAGTAWPEERGLATRAMVVRAPILSWSRPGVRRSLAFRRGAGPVCSSIPGMLALTGT